MSTWHRGHYGKALRQCLYPSVWSADRENWDRRIWCSGGAALQDVWVICGKYWVLVPLFQNQTGIIIDSYHGSHTFKSLRTSCSLGQRSVQLRISSLHGSYVLPKPCWSFQEGDFWWVALVATYPENGVPQKALVWGKRINSIPQQMDFAPSSASQSALLSLGFGLRLWSKTRPFIAMTAWHVPMILGFASFWSVDTSPASSLRGTEVPRLCKEYAERSRKIYLNTWMFILFCSLSCSVLTFEWIPQWMSEA